MKVQLSATIDAELSVKLSNKIKESNMSKSAYIQGLIKKDLGANESIIPAKKDVPKKFQSERLVIDVLNSIKPKSFTRSATKFKLSKLTIDGEYYYPFGKEDTTFTAVPIESLFGDQRLVSVRKPELEDILHRLMMNGRIYQPVKDCFKVV